MEEKKKVNRTAVFSFLQAILAKPFPNPGDTISFQTFSTNGSNSPEVYSLTRPAVDQLSYNSLKYKTVLQKLSLSTILEMFASILVERRVIVLSQSLTTLSSCVAAFNSLAFPFVWHHIYIPVLPVVLMDYCTAPMPFMVGVLKASLPHLEKMPIEEAVLLDVDTDQFLRSPSPPASSFLPPSLFSSLKKQLKVLYKVYSQEIQSNQTALTSQTLTNQTPSNQTSKTTPNQTQNKPSGNREGRNSPRNSPKRKNEDAKVESGEKVNGREIEEEKEEEEKVLPKPELQEIFSFLFQQFFFNIFSDYHLFFDEKRRFSVERFTASKSSEIQNVKKTKFAKSKSTKI